MTAEVADLVGRARSAASAVDEAVTEFECATRESYDASSAASDTSSSRRSIAAISPRCGERRPAWGASPTRRGPDGRDPDPEQDASPAFPSWVLVAITGALFVFALIFLRRRDQD